MKDAIAHLSLEGQKQLLGELHDIWQAPQGRLTASLGYTTQEVGSALASMANAGKVRLGTLPCYEEMLVPYPTM